MLCIVLFHDLTYVRTVQVMLLIDIQVAYINTKHEDFVGFNKWVSTSPLRFLANNKHR